MCSFVYKNSEVVCMFTMHRLTGYRAKANRDVDTVFCLCVAAPRSGGWCVQNKAKSGLFLYFKRWLEVRTTALPNVFVSERTAKNGEIYPFFKKGGTINVITLRCLILAFTKCIIYQSSARMYIILMLLFILKDCRVCVYYTLLLLPLRGEGR